MGAFHEMSAPSEKTWRWGWLALAVMVSACGPIQSTSYLMDAENMLQAGRTASADKLAPYEWTAANLYYVKSMEEVGYSDFEHAVDYAKKAADFATKARDVAVKLSNRPADEEPATPVAP